MKNTLDGLKRGAPKDTAVKTIKTNAQKENRKEKKNDLNLNDMQDNSD